MKAPIDDYRACEIAEGFGDGENATQEDQMLAWSHLIKTGLCWSLQGWYGRNAQRLIDNGYIDKDGNILL